MTKLTPVKPVYDVVKRVCDVVATLALILLLFPVLLLIAIVVSATSSGGALFHQQRVGLRGKPFTLHKFRTMRAANTGTAVTAGGDPRITTFGKILRRSKLDELPQLFNVLKGEMSLVGPRPEAHKFVSLYSDEQRRVLDVRPGITGLCQLTYRNEEALLAGVDDPETKYIEELMPDKLAIDLDYIRRRSLFLDASILIRTIAVLFR